MGNGNSKGLSVNAKTIILILLFLNVGFTMKMVKKYQTTKDAGYMREQTFKEQMERRVQKAFGSAEEFAKIIEDASRQKVDAEKVAEALKEQDIKTKYLNKKLTEARVKLLSERKHLQEEVQKLKLENAKLKKKQK
jgi:hypothetical protein